MYHIEHNTMMKGMKIILSHDALSTFYLWVYGIRTTDIGREETHCHQFMGYSLLLAARDLLYAPSHRIIYTIAYVSLLLITGLNEN